MSSKIKKGVSTPLWFSCDSCGCFISHKDLQEHKVNSCTLLDYSCEINNFNWKEVFIRNQSFFGILEESKNADVSTSFSKDVILLSQSAMQLCQFVIGDPVIIISKINEVNCTADGKGRINCQFEVKTIWPTTEGSVTSAFCPKQGMEMSWGLNYGPVQVTRLKTKPIPALQIVFNFTKPTDIPEKIDRFVKFLQYNTVGKIFHCNSRFAIDFYGKKIKLIILKIVPLKNMDDLEGVDGLIGNMENKLHVKDLNVSSSCDYFNVYQMFDNTKWSFEKDSDDIMTSTVGHNKVYLNDVGGYKDILSDLNNLLSDCLKKKNSSSAVGRGNGVRLAKGVLLYGPHGVGKTLFAHALANSSGSYIVTVHSGDLFSKFYGEAESRLRSLFEEASLNSPSVIILDGVDTICPNQGGSDQERRVIATLLSCLDSIDNRSVFVLATTSQLHLIHPALRRPGRLDREIEIPVPSLLDREDILMKMLRRSQPAIDEDIVKKVAAVAHGYVGADLSAVVTHAHTQVAQLNGNAVTFEVLEWALVQVKPSAMREVLVRVPDVKWSDIGGQDRLKLQLRQAVDWPLNHPEAFARLGITPPRGILMFGPPGCSKTMIAKALATESKLNFISIKGPELFSKWVGESERAVRAVFKRARLVAPSIVFLDELDATAGERGNSDGNSGGGSVQERVLAQLLTELDGVEPLRNVVIVAATNRPDRIDKALLRPGRLDRLIYVPLPDLMTRYQILQIQFRKTPVSSDVDVNQLASLMDGYSGAEVVGVCHEAALKALDEDRSASQVNLSHFKYALNVVTPRTPQSLLELYERYTGVTR